MAHVNGTHVKGVANATDLERIEFEIGGTSYRIDVFKDPPARVWNALKTVKPGETAFDQDTRMLELTVQDWDLGLEVSKAAIEDLQEPVRLAMAYLTTQYYLQLQQQHQDILQHIYRPGGDGQADPTRGSAPASESPVRSRGSRRTT